MNKDQQDAAADAIEGEVLPPEDDKASIVGGPIFVRPIETVVLMTTGAGWIMVDRYIAIDGVCEEIPKAIDKDVDHG